MYRGVAAETPATDAAVAATAGQIVTYDGAPVVTYFSASSGGHTENIEDAWPGSSASPWLRGVDDPYDGAGGDPYHHWTRQLSLTAGRQAPRPPGQGQAGRDPRDPARRLAPDNVGPGHREHGQHHGHRAPSSRARSACSARGPASPRSRRRPAPPCRARCMPAATWQSSPSSSALFGHDRPHSLALRGKHRACRPGREMTVEMLAGKTWRKLGTARLGKGGTFAVRRASGGDVPHRVPRPRRAGGEGRLRASASASPLKRCLGSGDDARPATRRRRAVRALPLVLRAARFDPRLGRPAGQRAARFDQPAAADRGRPRSAGDRHVLRGRGGAVPDRAVPGLPRRPPAAAGRAGLAVRARARAVRRVRLGDRVLA